ncbi:MAG: ABC transporter permease [Jatrophihabitans sp.]
MTAAVDDDPDLEFAEDDLDAEATGWRAVLAAGWFKSLISLAVGLGIWELIGRVFVTDRTFFVPFSTAMQSLWDNLIHGDLLGDIRTSLIELLGGFGLAVVIGIGVGAAMGLSPKIRSALIFWVDFFNATPVLALAPLFILALGIGMSSKIAFIAFVAVWTILLNTMTGFLHPDEGMLEMVSSFGATPWQRMRLVRIPFAIPSISVGLRVGVGRAVVGIVVGELFGSSSGVGYFLFSSRDQFDTAGIFAAIVVLAVMALVAVNLMALLERRLSRWR